MPIKMLFISNIVIAPYFQNLLSEYCSKYKTEISVKVIDYAACFADATYMSEEFDFIVVCLNFDCLFPDVLTSIVSSEQIREIFLNRSEKIINELYSFLKEHFYAEVLWFGFENYYCKYNRIIGDIVIDDMLVDEINLILYRILKDGDIYLDLKRMIADIGTDSAYDNRTKYCWNAPYSSKLYRKMGNEILRQCYYRRSFEGRKKCIVFDCDNVLWGGILVENGIEGVQLGTMGNGRKYREFQQMLLYMYYHGVILAISSKNNFEDVLDVFRNHDGMVVKEENIACFEVGWGSKADSLLRITERLHINIESIVFIDDSEHEIKEIQESYPEIETVWYGHDDIYKVLSKFGLKKTDIEMARKRTETYQTDELRKKCEMSSVSIEEYVQKLDMKIDIHRALTPEFSRIVELTQRTNRCTNGKRYALNSLKRKVIEHGYNLYSVSVSDRFCDLGIVGVIGIEEKILDLFALSCRAFGRGIEEKMLDWLRNWDIKRFTFVDTGKNKELLNILKNVSEPLFLSNGNISSNTID